VAAHLAGAGPPGRRPSGTADPDAVLNGITALPAPGEFLLTGKGWRHLYHVRMAEARTRRRPERLLAAG
jgi:Glutamine cyclotransferase